MSASTELTVNGSGGQIIPFDQTPDYLPQKVGATGLESMGKDDYKTPRILLLQPLSPQIRAYPGVALPGNFWHTGMNISLGTSFDFVPALAAKRVILWRPRDDANGGILAFSRDGKDWNTGGNQEFRVKVPGKNEPVVWATGKDVLSSKLTEFGTQDPDNPNGPPAATTAYEYLCYLPSRPDLSPCVLGVSKTGLPAGKQFNTALAMLVKSKNVPIWCIGARCNSVEQTKGKNIWSVPKFDLTGFVPKEVYEKAQKLASEFADYNIEYSQESDAPSAVEDEIPF